MQIVRNVSCKRGHFLEEGVTWDNKPSAFTLPDRVMSMIKPITWQLFGHIREGVTFPKIDHWTTRCVSCTLSLKKEAHNGHYYTLRKQYRRNSWTGLRKYIQAYYKLWIQSHMHREVLELFSLTRVHLSSL